MFVGAVLFQAVLASPLMARREPVQMRSTIEANPFERCGVKCSATLSGSDEVTGSVDYLMGLAGAAGSGAELDTH
jgi:hypothetical protein